MTEFKIKTARSPAIKFLLCSLGCVIALSFGGLFQPGEWYTQLNRAPWNPPNIAFPIVWSILYVLIALSGWIIAKANQPLLISLWWIQLALNAVWSWFFFGQQWILLALVDIVLILTIVGALIVRCRAVPDLKTAGNLLIPYFAWLLLALSLNAYIWIYN